MHELLTTQSATVNYPVRRLLSILESAPFHPLCWPVTEVGLRGDAFPRAVPDCPKGYGDHLALLRSMIGMQSLLTDGAILHRRFQTVKTPILVLVHGRENGLVDRSLKACGSVQPITDSSVFKLLERGATSEELLIRSLDFVPLGEAPAGSSSKELRKT